jgi:hypothetical protein
MVVITEQNVNVITLDNTKAKLKLKECRKRKRRDLEKGRWTNFSSESKISQLTKVKGRNRIVDIFSQVMKRINYRVKNSKVTSKVLGAKDEHVSKRAKPSFHNRKKKLSMVIKSRNNG